MNKLMEKFLNFLESIGDEIKNDVMAMDSKWLVIAIVTIVVLVFILINKIIKNKEVAKQKRNSTLEEGEFNKTVGDVREGFEEFRKSNLITPDNFYLFPEGLKHFEKADWNILLRMSRSLIKTDESMRRHYGEGISVEPMNAFSEDNQFEVRINKIEIKADTSTAVHISIKNNSLEPNKMFMGTSPKVAKKYISLTLDEMHEIVFESMTNSEVFKKTFEPMEVNKVILYFRTVDRANLKNLKSVKLDIIKENCHNFSVLTNINKEAFPDVISEIKSRLDLNRTQFFLSCGGYIFPLFITGLIVLFVLRVFHLPLLIGIGICIALFIFGMNLNVKLHQIIQDVRGEEPLIGIESNVTQNVHFDTKET